MNKLKEKYYIALGNLQNMAIDNTKGSKGVDICVLDINEYVAYLQSKIDKAIEFVKSMEYCGQEDYFYDNKSKDPCGNDNTFNDSKNKLLDILKEDK